MRGIADGPDDSVIVLEDDIDMEFDLEKRLRGMWPALPNNWDIVMLGSASFPNHLIFTRSN
jgi:GR25 family glycosyltransferase involved in LPS biosynthesis